MSQLLVVESKYTFIPPHEGNFWPRVLYSLAGRSLRKRYGITEVEIRHSDRLADMLRAGHGILLAPNHCRMSDPLVLQKLARHLSQPFFTMASSHLFRGSRMLSWVLRHSGGFSVYREGVDRQAVQMAIDILTQAKRPLVIFPEGALSLANDRLNALMEGVSFIARSAARKLEKSGDAGQTRRVYAVPVAIKYLFHGDVQQTVGAKLTEIERRLSWRPQTALPLVDRMYKLGHALLALKELEYLGEVQSGETSDRLARLVDHLLHEAEREWLGEPKDGPVIGRVKELRKAILPAMIEGELGEAEMQRRWRQLDDLQLAQSLSLYHVGYLATKPTVDRLLETVDRFSQDLDGVETPYPPTQAVVDIGNPIEVSAKRDRHAEGDPLLDGIEAELNRMLGALADESPLVESAGAVRTAP